MAFESGPQSSRIQEINQMMAQRKQELEASKRTVAQYQPQIIQTARQLRAQTQQGQVAVRSAEQQRILQKQVAERQVREAEQSLVDYEKEFDRYLRSPAGIVQYAEEYGIAPRTEQRVIPFGGKDVSVPVKVYETPYGIYVDEGMLQEVAARAELQTITTPEEATVFAAKQGIMGGWQAILPKTTEIEMPPEIKVIPTKKEMSSQVLNVPNLGNIWAPRTSTMTGLSAPTPSGSIIFVRPQPDIETPKRTTKSFIVDKPKTIPEWFRKIYFGKDKTKKTEISYIEPDTSLGNKPKGPELEYPRRPEPQPPFIPPSPPTPTPTRRGEATYSWMPGQLPRGQVPGFPGEIGFRGFRNIPVKEPKKAPVEMPAYFVPKKYIPPELIYGEGIYPKKKLFPKKKLRYQRSKFWIHREQTGKVRGVQRLGFKPVKLKDSFWKPKGSKTKRVKWWK